MTPWIYLSIAIVSEISATSILGSTHSFSRLWPSLAAVVLYSVSIFLLSLTIRDIPVGIAYAIWGGIGTAAVALVSVLILGDELSPLQAAGIAFVVAGVVALNL